MSLRLAANDQAMLDGKRGPAPQMAMEILTRMAEIFSANELLDISGAHIDSTIYIGDAGLEYAERLAELGARVAIPTTLNVSGLDEMRWQEWDVNRNWAQAARRQMVAYQSMGAIPTWTCAPYQTSWKPRFGQQIAWGESNAIVYANSVIGARTERYPDLLDICCAITARAPAAGLHLTENRAGQILFKLVGIPESLQKADEFYPVLGHLVGKIARERIPVLSGFNYAPTSDQHKAFGAAAASSGTVALYHMVGITPEASTLHSAFQGREPEDIIDLTMGDLRAARAELTTALGDQLDMVALGCPHFSIDEFKKLAALADGKQAHPQVLFHITTNRLQLEQASQNGYLEPLQNFGARFTTDTCILATPMLNPEIKNLMTNSGKYAYYSPGMLNTNITYGSLADCVRSAVAGRIIQEGRLWEG